MVIGSTNKCVTFGVPIIVSQEEEESPAEGSKDEPAEQGELKEEAEAPMEDTSQPPPSEPKGDAAREGETPDEKESGDKSEAQVSHPQRQMVESMGCGEGSSFLHASGANAFPTSLLFVLRSPMRRGRQGLRVSLQLPRKKKSRNLPGSRKW